MPDSVRSAKRPTSADVERKSLRVALGVFSLVALGALGPPLYRYAYDNRWFEDRRSERRIESVELALSQPGAPPWAGTYLGRMRQFWIGPRGLAVTEFSSSCGVMGTTDEGWGRAEFHVDRLQVHFPVLRRSWPRGGSLRIEFFVGRCGDAVFLLPCEYRQEFDRALSDGRDSDRDELMSLYWQDRRPRDFTKPIQFLGEEGWTD